ncbi:efflux RND transporter periplasmic adaptor subunit, partial [Paenibacillus sp.]|uniref:efflux RND transporter periplasmic adaptor subunit n=1 Tax=Paenibacillus sp. TaxID=58172 RepID=UPI002D30DC8C
MRKKWVWLLALVLVVGGLAAVNVARFGASRTVATATAASGVISESVFANGRFEAWSERTIFAERSGRIAAVHARVGDAVRPGDPLMTYNTSEWGRQLEEERDRLTIALLEREAERARHFEAVRGQSDPAEAEKIVEAEERAQRLHEVRVASLTRSVERLAQYIREDDVLSGWSGVVTASALEEGSRVTEGMEAFRLADVSRLVVRASLGELDAGKVRPGMRAVVTGDAFEGSYEGELTYVAPVARPAGADGLDTAVEIKVELPPGAVPPDAAKPGYAATLEFRIDGEARTLAPVDAVQYDGADAYVFRIADGVATRAFVTVGRDDGERIEILSGLEAGDAFVYPVPEDLREGD